MPAGTDPNTLPDNWFCYNHPNPAMAALSHTAPEEEYKMPAEAEVSCISLFLRYQMRIAVPILTSHQATVLFIPQVGLLQAREPPDCLNYKIALPVCCNISGPPCKAKVAVTSLVGLDYSWQVSCRSATPMGDDETNICRQQNRSAGGSSMRQSVSASPGTRVRQSWRTSSGSWKSGRDRRYAPP